MRRYTTRTAANRRPALRARPDGRAGSYPPPRSDATDLEMVTLMLTDIESSCRRWEADPVAMRRALMVHDRLMDDAIGDHGGRVLTSRGEGDSVFAVFELASQAVAAACRLQWAFERQAWPDGRPLRVRMALHSGEVEYDYRGRTVNRCARLRALARGGQVLLSGVTADLVRQSLPPGVRLRSLGRHDLRDLGPERVFELVIPGRSTEPPRSPRPTRSAAPL